MRYSTRSWPADNDDSDAFYLLKRTFQKKDTNFDIKIFICIFWGSTALNQAVSNENCLTITRNSWVIVKQYLFFQDVFLLKYTYTEKKPQICTFFKKTPLCRSADRNSLRMQPYLSILFLFTCRRGICLWKQRRVCRRP